MASVPVSNFKPPLTTAIFAVALPILKLITSPIAYPDPPPSINISSIEPDPISPTCIIASVPPVVKAILSDVLYKVPSFVIILEFIIPVIVQVIKLSSFALFVPVIFSPVIKVPTTLSPTKTNSTIVTPEIVNLNILSTIAVASFTVALAVSFA